MKKQFTANSGAYTYIPVGSTKKINSTMWQEWKREDEWGQIESERTLPADFKRAEVVEAFAGAAIDFLYEKRAYLKRIGKK